MRVRDDTGKPSPCMHAPSRAHEKSLGAEHPGTLRLVNNLAAIYESQGRYGEAEPLYVRTLAASERVQGAAPSANADLDQ